MNLQQQQQYTAFRFLGFIPMLYIWVGFIIVVSVLENAGHGGFLYRKSITF